MLEKKWESINKNVEFNISLVDINIFFDKNLVKKLISKAIKIKNNNNNNIFNK